MDPLGFAFENYDGLGKWRDTDAGKPVDASGTVTLDGSPKSFKNARELTRMLIDSPEARRCFATQLARFAWNRHDTEADRHSDRHRRDRLRRGGQVDQGPDGGHHQVPFLPLPERRRGRGAAMSILIKTPSTQARFSRRAFLRGAGASAATVPLLFAEPVRGQGTTPDGAPRRFVSVAWGNGIVRPEFYPAGDELVLGQVLQPLEPWKSKVLMPAGLDMKCLMDAGHRYAGHFSYGALLTGTYAKGWKSAGKSIDTVIAEELRKKGVNRPALQLNLGIAPDGEGTSWREAGVRNTSETDPARLYQTLFAGRNLSAPDLSKLRARRKSVLDFLTGELGVFSARLGTEDRMKIEAHTGSDPGHRAPARLGRRRRRGLHVAGRAGRAVQHGQPIGGAVWPADRGPALRPDPGGDHGRLRRARQVRRLALVHRRLGATITRWPTRAARATPRR